MTGEYWDGWFDHWGDAHQKRPAAVQIREIQWMMDRGYSFNLYMEEGGTTFGWMNGANSDGKDYAPDTTSYDYDVPIGERGELRPKFFAIRDIIAKATKTDLPAPPAPATPTTYAIRPTLESASLWQNLPESKRSRTLLSMEDLDQAYGYILYTTKLPANAGTSLEVDTVHDYAAVYVDHEPVGTLDRRLGQSTLMLPASASGKELQILVENTGRVNYTAAIRGERQGITDKVSIDGKPLEHWQIYSLPMNNVSALKFNSANCSGPCFFRTSLIATGREHDLADTYLNTTEINKGFVWVNVRPLGRAWKIGPQGALYLPGSWLKNGANEIDFFDLDGGVSDAVGSSDHPLFFEPPVESLGDR
jgi:beta-galactosidase